MTEPTLADYAELWCKDRVVPERETPEWLEMYSRWIHYAFEDFRETIDDPPVRKRAAERGETC